MTYTIPASTPAPTLDPIPEHVEKPQRCVIVLDRALPPGKAANAAAVIALTIGQRHPGLVGEPLIDASEHSHPGLIPIGIPVLAASREELSSLRRLAITLGCDIVDFPAQGQQTTNYAAFRDAVAAVHTVHLSYVGVALIGAKKPISKAVAHLELLK